jgi:hypothetical protein
MISNWDFSPNAGTQWHDYEVRLSGQNLTFLYDDSVLGSTTLTGGDVPQGRIGAGSGYDATHLLYDDFVVRKCVDPEPTVTS